MPDAPALPPHKRNAMKRIVLFLLTNIGILLVLSVSAHILGVNRYLTANGLNLGMLLAFAAAESRG